MSSVVVFDKLPTRKELWPITDEYHPEFGYKDNSGSFKLPLKWPTIKTQLSRDSKIPGTRGVKPDQPIQEIDAESAFKHSSNYKSEKVLCKLNKCLPRDNKLIFPALDK